MCWFWDLWGEEEAVQGAGSGICEVRQELSTVLASVPVCNSCYHMLINIYRV